MLFILCKEVFQLLQETFRDRRESLISVPCYIQRSFKRGLQGAEHKAAPARVMFSSLATARKYRSVRISIEMIPL